MQNPTLVVLTDRNDLDDQLFGQFQRCAANPLNGEDYASPGDSISRPQIDKPK